MLAFDGMDTGEQVTKTCALYWSDIKSLSVDHILIAYLFITEMYFNVYDVVNLCAEKEFLKAFTITIFWRSIPSSCFQASLCS